MLDVLALDAGDAMTKAMNGATRLVNCRCYVLKLPLEVALTLHWGAHEIECPTYRPSLDPVDRANDEEFRARHERGSGS